MYQVSPFTSHTLHLFATAHYTHCSVIHSPWPAELCPFILLCQLTCALSDWACRLQSASLAICLVALCLLKPICTHKVAWLPTGAAEGTHYTILPLPAQPAICLLSCQRFPRQRSSIRAPLQHATTSTCPKTAACHCCTDRVHTKLTTAFLCTWGPCRLWGQLCCPEPHAMIVERQHYELACGSAIMHPCLRNPRKQCGLCQLCSMPDSHSSLPQPSDISHSSLPQPFDIKKCTKSR